MKITPKQLRSLVEDHGIWLGSVNLFGDCRQQFLKEGGRTYYTHVLWLLEFYLDDYQEKNSAFSPTSIKDDTKLRVGVIINDNHDNMEKLFLIVEELNMNDSIFLRNTYIIPYSNFIATCLDPELTNAINQVIREQNLIPII